jgi:hypothetical protein
VPQINPDLMGIQAVLANVNAPVYPGAWRPASDGDMPPAQYIVHNYARAPDFSAADAVAEYAIYAYVVLYSTISPSEMILEVRAVAEAAGWGTVDERSGYDSENNCYMTSWTFVEREAV